MQKIDLVLSAGSGYAPSENLAGNLSWYLDFEPLSITLNLFWFTLGKGTRDAQVVGSQSLPAMGRRQGSQEFTFHLPQGPPSFSGKLITLQWAVEAVVEPNALTARAEFVMGPAKQEIQLSEI